MGQALVDVPYDIALLNMANQRTGLYPVEIIDGEHDLPVPFRVVYPFVTDDNPAHRMGRFHAAGTDGFRGDIGRGKEYIHRLHDINQSEGAENKRDNLGGTAVVDPSLFGVDGFVIIVIAPFCVFRLLRLLAADIAVNAPFVRSVYPPVRAARAQPAGRFAACSAMRPGGWPSEIRHGIPFYG
jgi:hypothetical protein